MKSTRANNPPSADAVADIIAYHERTKHHPERYAKGPPGLDWATQPSPFRSFTGAPRFRLPLPVAAGFYVGLTSIVWREAWKYGERAFRYCQHDVGHALAALRFAAAALGWLSRETLLAILDTTLPRASTPPFDAWPFAARLHPILFVHRVTGFKPAIVRRRWGVTRTSSPAADKGMVEDSASRRATKVACGGVAFTRSYPLPEPTNSINLAAISFKGRIKSTSPVLMKV